MKQAKLGVTKAKFARDHGLSEQYVGRLVNSGRIPALPNGRLDPALAAAALADVTKHSRSRRFAAQPGLADAELRRANADARLKEVRAAEKEGMLIPIDMASDAIARLGAAIKSHILSFPSRAAQLAPLESRQQTQTAAEKLCRDVCNELIALADKVFKDVDVSERRVN